MDVLVVGGGGREHALVWKLRQSRRVDRVYAAPGNGGIAKLAECTSIAPADLDGLVAFATDRKVDLALIGPEQPLTLGLADRLSDAGIRAFGPNREAACLEGSKQFAKELMRDAGVPTAKFEVFDRSEAAVECIRRYGAPVVVKADGLAAGKGAIVCATEEEAVKAAREMLDEGAFGEAGQRVVVEECLEGEEASFLALTDGETVLPLDSSQDHKRIFDGDRGPNTGGMGAYSPAPVVTPELARLVVTDVLEPVVSALRDRGIRYRGVLYAGLMIGSDGPKVLEFNARFGDPECQVLLVRLKNDIIDVCEAVVEGRLDEVHLDWDPRPAVCVVLAAGGYPGAVETGEPIHGIDALGDWSDGVVFHAGTAVRRGELVTSGGRVLGVTALGETIEDAVRSAYDAADRISWNGMQYRRDIGARAIARGS